MSITIRNIMLSLLSLLKLLSPLSLFILPTHYAVMEQKGYYAYTPGNIALQGGQGNKGSLDWMSGFYPFDC